MNVIKRPIFCCIILLLFTGCQNVSFRSMVPPEEYVPSTLSSSESDEKVLIQEPDFSTFEYGNFVVQDLGDRHRLFGGKIETGKPLSIKSKHPRVITINFRTKKLSYYELTDSGEHEFVIGYATVTPSVDILGGKMVRGIVARIETEPDWYPTKNVRLAYPDLPKGLIPYGHPDNAMGEVKIVINWDIAGWRYRHIHGTVGYTQGDFWNVETFGCTRLQNKAILNLAKLLGPDAVDEKIEVIVLGA
jgi:hypothetical protein